MNIFTKIPFEQNHSITIDGTIRNDLTGVIRKPTLDRYGYLKLTLYPSGKTYTVHRLVALTFIPNPYDKPQVNHIDNNKINNHIPNLEWCTAKENIHHVHKSGRAADVNGSNNPMSKLTECDVFNIRYVMDDIPIKVIADLYNVSTSPIENIRYDKSWRYI